MIAKIKDLPSISNVVVKLSQLLNDENSSSADFEKVIRHDPSLTTNLLRIANSAFFGCPREVRSVRQAITLMGVERVFEVATSASLMKILPSKIPGYEVEAESFWKHCISVAILGEKLTVELGIKAPDLAYTAGLLHDIGKLAVGSFLGDQLENMQNHIFNGPMTMLEVERELLGTDHCEVGSALAQIWNLPPQIALAARWHHDPLQAPAGVDTTLLDLIHVANAASHMLGYGADVAELHRRLEQGVLKRMGLKVQRMEFVVSESLEQIQALGEIF